MPRYLVERIYTVDLDALAAVAIRSKSVAYHRYPEIVWEHSYVVIDADGTPKTFCVYAGPSKEMVLEHSQSVGDHWVQTISEIAGDVTPDDFPLTDDPG